MSLEAITWAYKTQVGSPTRKAVLLVLANYADADDASSYPGRSRIEKMTELKTTAVKDALRDLAEMGVIQVEPRLRQDGSSSSNRYVINMGWSPDDPSPLPTDDPSRSGDDPRTDTKQNRQVGTTNPMPAARVRVERSEQPKRRRGKGFTAMADEMERTGSLPASDKPAEVTPIRKPTVGGLAKQFEREARTVYPLGDPRRITNMTALRDNIARWRDNGIELEDIGKAIDAFWTAGMVREGQEPWKRFITTITVTLGKATAPDITNPDYYTTPQEEHEMDAAEKWLKENGL